MRIRTLPALAILLTVMVAPVHAVDPAWEVTDPDYLAVRAGRPGALLRLQMAGLKRDVSAALDQYRRATGGKPPSPLHLDRAGFLPFRPLGESGAPMPFVELTAEGLPAPGTVGVRYVGDEIQLIAMGADGDSLSPLVESVPMHRSEPLEIYPIASPLVQRRLSLFDSALRWRLRGASQVRGAVPESWDEVLATLGWELNPSAMPSTGAADAEILLEWDPESWLFRTTWDPAPAWSPTTCGRLDRQTGSSGEHILWETRDPLRDCLPDGSYPQKVRLAVLDREEVLERVPWPGAGQSARGPRPTGMFKPAVGLAMQDFNTALGLNPTSPQPTAAAFLAVLQDAPWLDWPVDSSGDPWALHFVRRDSGRSINIGRSEVVPASESPRVEVTYFTAIDEGDPPTPGFGVWPIEPGLPRRQPKGQAWPFPAEPHIAGYRKPWASPEALRQELDSAVASHPKPWPRSLESAYVYEYIMRSEGAAEKRVRLFEERFWYRLEEYRDLHGDLPPSAEALVQGLGVRPCRYEIRPPGEPFGAAEIGVRIDREPSGVFLRMVIHYGDVGEQWMFYEAPREGISNMLIGGLPHPVFPLFARDVAELDYTPAYRFTLIEPTWTPEIVEVTE